jgi:hypothetical protein
MKIYFEKNLLVLLFVLVSASTLVSLPKVELALTGVKEVYSKQDFGLRILRKAMLVGLASQHGGLEPLAMNGRITGDGRLVWKTSGSSLSACCENRERDGRQGTDIR